MINFSLWFINCLDNNTEWKWSVVFWVDTNFNYVMSNFLPYIFNLSFSFKVAYLIFTLVQNFHEYFILRHLVSKCFCELIFTRNFTSCCICKYFIDLNNFTDFSFLLCSPIWDFISIAGYFKCLSSFFQFHYRNISKKFLVNWCLNHIIY